MATTLHGRVAVITGAGRGIGAAIARAFASEGAAVVLGARSEDQVQAVAREVAAAGGRAVGVRVDVTDDASVGALAAAAEDAAAHWGGTVDVLVNNAGRHQVGRFLDYTMADWEAMFAVNVHGTVRVTQALLPGMVAAGRGRVVNVASTAGKYGSLFQSPYNASKHAVVGLTRCLALETAKQGVTVNAICPGFVETEMIDEAAQSLSPILGMPAEQVPSALLSRVPQGRLLQPEEVARLAVYLASDDAAGMTGQALTISGGLVLV